MGEFDGLHAELTKKILGVFYEVARELGFGFLESVYEEAMLIALAQAGLKVEQQVKVPVCFRGKVIGTFFADIIVEGIVVLELKTADVISNAFEAQVLHYLRGSSMEIGYVLAFGETPRFRRVILQNNRKPSLGNRPPAI